MDFDHPETTAREGIQCFKRFLKSIGMPLTFAELGAKEEDIPVLVRTFGLRDGETTGGFVHLSSEDVEKIYRDSTLASKVQEKIESKEKVTVTEDEARKSTIYRVVFATTKTDKEGKTTQMSAKEKKAVKAKAEAALKEIQSGKKTIKKVAKEQNYSNTDESYAAGESEEGEAFEGVMKGMKDGDIADKVLECNNGYVIAKLVAYTDKEETASNKKSLKEQKQSEAFQKKYDNWTKKLEKKWDYNKDVDQKLWAQLSLKSADSTSTEKAEETTAAK